MLLVYDSIVDEEPMAGVSHAFLRSVRRPGWWSVSQSRDSSYFSHLIAIHANNQSGFEVSISTDYTAHSSGYEKDAHLNSQNNKTN